MKTGFHDCCTLTFVFVLGCEVVFKQKQTTRQKNNHIHLLVIKGALCDVIVFYNYANK